MRFILGLIGAAFALILTISLFSNLATYFSNPREELAAEALHREPKNLHLASDGVFAVDPVARRRIGETSVDIVLVSGKAPRTRRGGKIGRVGGEGDDRGVHERLSELVLSYYH